MAKKIINQPDQCVSEAMEGFLAANREYVQVEGASAIRVREVREKPAMIVGGGSGHEPMFGYFVGENLAACSPPPIRAASSKQRRLWSGARGFCLSMETIPGTT